MKINKKRFWEAIKYIRAVNQCDLSELDFSELGVIPDLDMAKVQHLGLGLNNKDFITMNFPDSLELKYKLVTDQDCKPIFDYASEHGRIFLDDDEYELPNELDKSIDILFGLVERETPFEINKHEYIFGFIYDNKKYIYYQEGYFSGCFALYTYDNFKNTHESGWAV